MIRPLSRSNYIIFSTVSIVVDSSTSAMTSPYFSEAIFHTLSKCWVRRARAIVGGRAEPEVDNPFMARTFQVGCQFFVSPDPPFCLELQTIAITHL